MWVVERGAFEQWSVMCDGDVCGWWYGVAVCMGGGMWCCWAVLPGGGEVCQLCVGGL